MKGRVAGVTLVLCCALPAFAAGRSPSPGGRVWRRLLSRVAAPVSDAEIRAEKLEPVGSLSLRGARPKLMLRDSRGRMYMFKQHNPAHTWMERELFAVAIRRAGGEPTIPVVPLRLEHEGHIVEGMVKPFIDARGELPSDPRRWNAGQRAAVMADHAWAEVTGNYDLKTDQTLLVPVPGVRGGGAVNGDWDLSLTDYLTERPVSRYKAMNAAPPAQNLLYNDFVHGRLELSFRPLRDAVRRIQRIPDQTVVAALQPFLAKAFAGGRAHGPYQKPQELIDAVLRRKASLERTFDKLIRDLRAERRAHEEGRGAFAGLGKLRVELRDARMVAWGKLVQSSLFKRFQQVFRRFVRDLPPESSAFNRGGR
jgi:hypothetical protein